MHVKYICRLYVIYKYAQICANEQLGCSFVDFPVVTFFIVAIYSLLNRFQGLSDDISTINDEISTVSNRVRGDLKKLEIENKKAEQVIYSYAPPTCDHTCLATFPWV